MGIPPLNKYSGLDTLAVGGPSDLWAAGVNAAGIFTNPPKPYRLILLHWDGHAWTRAASPPTGMWTKFVNGAQSLSASDAWVVGFAKVHLAGDALRHPLALHWTGHTWTSTPVPSGPGELYQLAQAGGQLWAVGDTFSPTATSYTMDFLRWTGSRWVHGPLPVQGEASLFADAAIPGGGLWAAGASGTGNRPLIELWD